MTNPFWLANGSSSGAANVGAPGAVVVLRNTATPELMNAMSRTPSPSRSVIGQLCDENEQCASDLCEFDHCKLKSGGKLSKGEKCDYTTDCISNRCYEDKCE